MGITFTPSERSSLGIEWELELVDLDSRELTGVATEVLAALGPGDPVPPGAAGSAGAPDAAAGVRGTGGADTHPKAKHELFECTVEVITGVCTTVAEAVADLRGTVEDVAAAAAAHNAGLMCSGTHPFTDWTTQRISPNPRYLALVEQMQWLARRLQIFGVHVHVGVRAPEKVIPIVNALTGYVPHLLALSASSPYWQGADTGLASVRSKVFEALPTAGLPLQLSGWDQFETYMQTLISSNTIQSIREVWWDIRPHPDFGTVELRICDGLPTYDEVAAIAALSQCLVERLDRELDRGYTLPVPKGWVLRENKWRAARYGLDADIIADDRGTVIPLRQAVTDLVEDLMPIARRLDCAAELSSVERILAVGASYARQRAVATANQGDLTAVVDALLGEFREGLPR